MGGDLTTPGRSPTERLRPSVPVFQVAHLKARAWAQTHYTRTAQHNAYDSRPCHRADWVVSETANANIASLRRHGALAGQPPGSLRPHATAPGPAGPLAPLRRDQVRVVGIVHTTVFRRQPRGICAAASSTEFPVPGGPPTDEDAARRVHRCPGNRSSDLRVAPGHRCCSAAKTATRSGITRPRVRRRRRPPVRTTRTIAALLTPTLRASGCPRSGFVGANGPPRWQRDECPAAIGQPLRAPGVPRWFRWPTPEVVNPSPVRPCRAGGQWLADILWAVSMLLVVRGDRSSVSLLVGLPTNHGLPVPRRLPTSEARACTKDPAGLLAFVGAVVSSGLAAGFRNEVEFDGVVADPTRRWAGQRRRGTPKRSCQSNRARQVRS